MTLQMMKVILVRETKQLDYKILNYYVLNLLEKICCFLSVESHQKSSSKSVSSRRRSRPIIEDKDAGVVRRSSRQRKLLYGTFDPKILERALYVDKQSYDHEEDNPRKKRRVEDTNADVTLHL